MTDPELRDLFAEAAPAAPSTVGWADNARARRRRRRTFTGVAVAVLAVGVGVPVGATLLSRPVQVAQPAATATLPDRVASDVCQQAQQQVTDTFQAGAQGEAALEPGAVRAWLCGDGTADAGMAFGTVGPSYPLTEDVDQAVDWFLQAPEADPNQACTMEYRLTYTVAFEYPDGTLAPVQGALHGCRTVTDGSATKSGGQEYFDLLTSLWASHPAATPAPVEATCSGAATMLQAAPADVTSGAFCQQTDVTSSTMTTAELSPELVASIATSLRESSAEVSEPERYLEPSTQLQLFTPQGAKLTLSMLIDGTFSYYVGDQEWEWTAPGDVYEELKKVADQPLP